MKNNKLSLKKITVSNLSEDFAKRIFGGDQGDTETYNSPNGTCVCTEGSTIENCQCQTAPTGCGETCQPNCTGDQCPVTYDDMSCAENPATCTC